MKDMIKPIITLKTTAPIIRAIPRSNPKIRAVRIIAKILMAGPEYKNVMAGPKPAPRLCMLENRGKIVQLQTASIVPDNEAIRYAFHFFAPAPKYLITAPWLTKMMMET